MTTRDHVDSLDARLDRLSVGRCLIERVGLEPSRVELAVHRAGVGYTPERPAIPSQLVVEPWSVSDEADGHTPSTLLRGRACVSNVLNVMLPMPSTTFAFVLALPPLGAEAIYDGAVVRDSQEAVAEAPPAWLTLGPTGAPHPAVRREIERVFMNPGARAPAVGRAEVTYTCRTMGHRLTRRADRYADPGSGAWTLFRAVQPGDGWIALNLFEGWGELFSAGRDDETTLFGEHLARAIG